MIRMNTLTVQTKVLLLLTLLLVIAVICLTMGAALLNYAQTRTQNAERLTTALGSFQREFEREIVRDLRLFYESLTNSFKTTLAFKAMVLIDSADVQIPARMIELGTLFNAVRLAFYYQIEGDDALQLRLYYDRGLGGAGQIYLEGRTPKHRLIQKQADGQIMVTDLPPPPQIFPLTFPPFAQALLLETTSDGLLLVADLPYRSAFNEVNYNLHEGEELGRFLLEKPLDLNLSELDNDLGVHFTIYDLYGHRGQGAIPLPDFDPGQEASTFAYDQVVRLKDADGKTYDTMLRPLTYQNTIVGYVAANISQAKTFQKIGETVRVLVLIACGVMLIAFLLMSVVVRRLIAQPLQHITMVTHRQLRGELEARVELKTMDEYGELGQTFNRLSQQVNTLLHEQRLTIANLTRAEAALRESETFLYNIIENIPNMIFVKDAGELRFVRLNKAGEALLGYSRDELLGKNDYDFFPKDEAEFFVHNDRVTLAQKALLDIPEEPIRTRHHGERILHTKKIPILDPMGNPLYLLGISEDITERKQAEEALKESEEKFRSLAEQSPNMIFINKGGKVVYANKRCEEIMGYTRAEFYAADFDFVAITAPEYVDMVKTRFTQHMRGEDVEPYEYALVTKDGARIEAIIAPKLINYRGESAILGVITDISERKRAEAEIRMLNAGLEQRVRERTAKLEVVNNELQSFAYIISHDLKAPLRNITQLVNWLVTDYAAAFDDRGKQYADLLLNRVKRMDNLITSVLEYSRVGRVEMQNAPLDLAALLREVIDTLDPPPHITISLPDVLPTIVADKTRLMQVFQNLIGNAIKFMDKPQGEITINCVDNGESWKFMVSDNGPGIDPNHHERIFKIFQTLRPRDEVESTGVGLAIVKKIIELYGGQVGIDSEIGKGSTFWFTFPK